MRLVDLRGQRFGKLLVVAKLKKKDDTGKIRWRCVCDCGGERRGRAQNIKRTGHCGCGTATCHTTHGLTYHPLYDTHRLMIERCHGDDSKYFEGYRDRGIKVCKAWHNIENFIAWAETQTYGPGLELDRRNNDKGYNPSNCRFVTRSVNNRNKRNNKYCMYKGKKRLFIEVWEEIGKVSYKVAVNRYFAYDWNLNDALTLPPRKYRRTA